MFSSDVISSDDFCQRKTILEQSWELNALTPSQILRRAVQYGLAADGDDAGQSAGDYAMGLCVDRPIDTDEMDLLGIAEHTAALADMIVWMTTGGGWKRPTEASVGSHAWTSGVFLSKSGHKLRQLLIVDTWTDGRKSAAMNSWGIGGEMSIYGMPMTLIVAVIGKRREGRWRGPWTLGYEHPVSYDLRFRKRDGEAFGSTWKRVFREHFKGTREDWLNSLTDDGLLPEMLMVEELDIPDHAEEIRALAERKLDRIAATIGFPDPKLSMCDSALSPCQFRSECPRWRMPSHARGFIQPT